MSSSALNEKNVNPKNMFSCRASWEMGPIEQVRLKLVIFMTQSSHFGFEAGKVGRPKKLIKFEFNLKDDRYNII